MNAIEQYRPPGRSNRSGRSNADNDVFEGLPVKQWTQAFAKVSLAPPVSEIEASKDDKWGEPPMPRDFQLLTPWTQHLLRLARSGKVGTKRKQDADADDDKPDDEVAEEDTKPTSNSDDRGYVAKKWKPVPEHSLEPEHKHFNFLAKRRRGLPSLYGPDLQLASVPMRKTKVQKADANGEIAVYEVLVPEGQTIEGEIAESTELADAKPVLAAPGTVIEGVGVANEEGVMVAEHLKPSMPRRNRPPPKKKGGPGRGKKRVTFTNPDGSTYTAIVPNATKIVPQPGQTIKHVAKGEEATADVSVEEAARNAAQRHDENGEEGSGDDDEEGDEDDDDREDGELSDEDDDDAPATGAQTPAIVEEKEAPQPMEDVQPTLPTASTEAEPALPETSDKPAEEPVEPAAPAVESAIEPITEPVETRPDAKRSVESSPDLPLAQGHSSAASVTEPAPLTLDTVPEEKPLEEPEAGEPLVEDPPIEEPITTEPAEAKPAEVELTEEAAPTAESLAPVAPAPAEEEEKIEKFDDGDEDLLGNLEKSLGQ
ncbi:hypothetical protein CBER1_04339 [Cercospora berteroae]|uniref:Uncharacterized protein n=1 Tax=Cercospora berteroae TaxID=357750 RepID=A0A2S6CJ93_9PEZI|nr:hypothetical protein CBER1_04339 [Cercospora berteroae]